MDPALAATLARRTDVLDRLRRILVERLNLRVEPDEIDPDAPLFGSGLRLDSIDALDLVVNVEQEFALILVDRKGLSPLPLRTLNTIADRVIALQDAA
jgi:acyl carrier protein